MAGHVMAGRITLECDRCQEYPAWKREQLGCDGPGPSRVARVDGVDMFECPGRVLGRDATLMLACSNMRYIESGVWPSSGGLLDQSATFKTAADIVSATTARLTSEDMENAKNGR